MAIASDKLSKVDEAVLDVVKTQGPIPTDELPPKVRTTLPGTTTSEVRDSMLWLINRERLTLTTDRHVKVFE